MQSSESYHKVRAIKNYTELTKLLEESKRLQELAKSTVEESRVILVACNLDNFEVTNNLYGSLYTDTIRYIQF